jgi:hypothetical protein
MEEKTISPFGKFADTGDQSAYADFVRASAIVGLRQASANQVFAITRALKEEVLVIDGDIFIDVVNESLVEKAPGYTTYSPMDLVNKYYPVIYGLLALKNHYKTYFLSDIRAANAHDVGASKFMFESIDLPDQEIFSFHGYCISEEDYAAFSMVLHEIIQENHFSPIVVKK